MRGRKPGYGHRFYVYRFDDAQGAPLYIGKGSGRRLKAQEKRFGCKGAIVATFYSESAAYRCEARLIAKFRPAMNKCAGGGGPIAKPSSRRRFKWGIEMERIGTRAYAARGLLRLHGIENLVTAEQMKAIRAAAA